MASRGSATPFGRRSYAVLMSLLLGSAVPALLRGDTPPALTVGYPTGGAIIGAAAPRTLDQGWRPLTTLSSARSWTGQAELGGKVHVVGGFIGSGAGTTFHEAYDLATGQWSTTLAPLPVGRYGVTLATLRGKLYAIGGL